MKTPAFQFYPSDWLSDFHVRAMTYEQRGIYIDMLCLMWGEQDCMLPDDLTVLERMLNVPSTTLEIIMQRFQKKDGKIFSKRLLEERKKQEDWRRKSRKGGLKSAKLRTKGGLTTPQPPLQPKANSPSPSPIYNKFIEESNKRNIEIDISESKYLELREEYINNENIIWFNEVKGCLEWLKDNNFKKISTNRLRNRMKKAIEFAKAKERKRLEDQQEKINPEGVKKVKKKIQEFSDKIGIADFPELSKEEGRSQPELFNPD
jgi:uncharacterized protein YdaU (DUF1376 family)